MSTVDPFDYQALAKAKPKITTGQTTYVLPPGPEVRAHADVTLQISGDPDGVAQLLSAYDPGAAELFRTAIGHAMTAADELTEPHRRQAKADQDHIDRLAHTLISPWVK